jgi:hypothetical protein
MDAHVRARALRERLGAAADATGLAALLEAGTSALDAGPCTAAELARLLGDRWPDADPAALATVVRMAVPTVQVLPRGLWRTPGPAAFTTVRAWSGRDIADPPDVEAMVRRFIEAEAHLAFAEPDARDHRVEVTEPDRAEPG